MGLFDFYLQYWLVWLLIYILANVQTFYKLSFNLGNFDDLFKLVGHFDNLPTILGHFDNLPTILGCFDNLPTISAHFDNLPTNCDNQEFGLFLEPAYKFRQFSELTTTFSSNLIMLYSRNKRSRAESVYHVLL